MQDAVDSKDPGYALMAAAFEVHNTLGGGLSERVYQESLEIEMEERGITFSSQEQIPCYYKNRILKTRYIPDLIVDKQIIVELKACNSLDDDHMAQVLNYLKITRLKVGYLINLAPADGVEWRRIINTPSH